MLATALFLFVAQVPPPVLPKPIPGMPSSCLERVTFDAQPGITALVETVAVDPSLSLRQLAAIALTLHAEGSTLSDGPQHATLREVMARIRSGTPPPQPLPVFDELLVATALLRAGNDGRKSLRNSARESLERLCHLATDTNVPPFDAEQHLLFRLLAAEVKVSGQFRADVLQLVENTVTHARVSFHRGAERRSDAAHDLARAIGGERIPDDQLVALTWPADLLADPLHTWIGVMAASRTALRTRQATLSGLLPVALALGRGDHGPGTLAPAAGLDAVTTAALQTMVLTLANRTNPVR
jgi:hypothetical protein